MGCVVSQSRRNEWFSRLTPRFSTTPWILVCLLAWGFLAVDPTRGAAQEAEGQKTESANAGQADLDQATALRLNAQSMADMERVIELCEAALQKGLDEQSSQIAKSLLSASLYQHAARFAQAIFNPREQAQKPEILRQFALRDLTKAIEHNDNSPEIHLLVARLEAVRGGNRERGLRSAERAVALLAEDKPNLSKALVARASFQQETEAQFADLDNAILADPKNGDAYRLRGMLRVNQSEQLARSEKVEEAKAELAKAIDDFMHLIEENPQDISAHELVAGLLARSGQFDDSMKHLDEAIKLSPASPTPYRMRARILLGQQKIDEAIQDLNRAVDLSPPDDTTILLERSQLYIQKGNFDAAKADVEKALQIEPELLTAVLHRSLIATEQKHYDEAINDLKRVIAASPDPRLRLQLGNIFVRANRPQDAVPVFTEVLKEHPEEVLALRGRGDAYLGTGEHSKAIEDYEAAYKLQSEDDGILNNLAWVLATSPDAAVRNGERAVELAKKACSLTDYKEAHILSTLAAAYAETGNFEEAIKYSEKAVESDSTQIEQLKKELESYQKKKPWRESQVTPGADVNADVKTEPSQDEK